MLLILYSISSDQLKKRSVESVWKNKIKAGNLRETLITETFDILLDVSTSGYFIVHLFIDSIPLIS